VVIFSSFGVNTTHDNFVVKGIHENSAVNTLYHPLRTLTLPGKGGGVGSHLPTWGKYTSSTCSTTQNTRAAV
jgi:hypothetical protein